MRFFQMILGLAAATCLATTPADADQPGHGGHDATHAQAPKLKTHPPAPAAKQPAPATKPHGNPHVEKPHGRPHDVEKPHGKPHTVPPTDNVARRIASHPQLASRLQPLLPPGMTLDTAAAGFKNQGQFIAALHVSRNLGISFAQLKAEMTGPHHDSLGRAIQQLRPRTDVKSEVRRAERQAHDDVHVTKVKPNVKKVKGDRDKDREDRR